MRIWKAQIAFLAFLLLVSSITTGRCESAGIDNAEFPELTRLRTILQQPEDQMDLGRIKLTIDKMVNPSTDIEGGIKQLDEMTFKIRGMAGSFPSQKALISALRQFLYDKGPWNNFKPFHYDLTDPLGDNIQNQELLHYLSTKTGNCASMPLLFVILGQRLGLPVTIATAPNHCFVKYADQESGRTFNLEATSGALPARDEYFREKMHITDMAVQNGIYLRPLSKQETVELYAGIVAWNLDRNTEFEKAIAISDLLLEYSPTDVNAMLRKGHAYYGLLAKHFLKKYPQPNQIPVPERAYFQELTEANRYWYSKAESLGWREPTKEEERDYLDTINRIAESQAH